MVYLDAGHSDWTPHDDRAALLKKAGIGYDRGLSTNVANYRTTADEKDYAGDLFRGLRKPRRQGMHYVIDIVAQRCRGTGRRRRHQPTWALIGKPPRLVLDGAFDGNLWVQAPRRVRWPGQRRRAVRGQWCDLLADRLPGPHADPELLPLSTTG